MKVLFVFICLVVKLILCNCTLLIMVISYAAKGLFSANFDLHLLLVV